MALMQEPQAQPAPQQSQSPQQPQASEQMLQRLVEVTAKLVHSEKHQRPILEGIRNAQFPAVGMGEQAAEVTLVVNQLAQRETQQRLPEKLVYEVMHFVLVEIAELAEAAGVINRDQWQERDAQVAMAACVKTWLQAEADQGVGVAGELAQQGGPAAQPPQGAQAA